MSAFARHLQSNTIRVRALSALDPNHGSQDSTEVISHQRSQSQGTNTPEYIVHRSLLTQHLRSLQISAHERVIDLEDSDDETLGYLLEFVYTGDYTPSSPSLEEPSSSQDVVMGDAGDEEHDAKKKEEDEIHPMVLAARTSALGVWGRAPALHTKFLHTDTTSTSTSSAESGSETDVTSPSSHSSTSSRTVNETVTPPKHHETSPAAAFLIHAKIYLLADRYGASSLKEVALEKLRAALKTSKLEPQADQVGALVGLIQSIYQLPPITAGEETKNPDEDTRQKLKQMVVAQAVHYLADLHSHEEFKGILKDGGGEFVQDLLSHLMNRKLTL
ncbi:MAG: hypothetical protein M1823_004714 [Watsoniomyces obsoletus]|nr:MAG: hypothetical protein M1823_004714 [Watsoniomyces obsoletus]